MSTSEATVSIGGRLRELRRASGQSLTAVAEAVGISSSALSQIETGVMQPSVNRLIEIIGVVGAPVAALFDGYDVAHPAAEAGVSTEPLAGVLVSSASAGHTAALGQGVTYRRLTPAPIAGIDLFESVYPPLTSSSVDGAMLVHRGYETGSVQRGRLRFEFTEGAVELSAGDTISFWATRPHRVVNASPKKSAVAIWLTLADLSDTPAGDDVNTP